MQERWSTSVSVSLLQDEDSLNDEDILLPCIPRIPTALPPHNNFLLRLRIQPPSIVVKGPTSIFITKPAQQTHVYGYCLRIESICHNTSLIRCGVTEQID